MSPAEIKILVEKSRRNRRTLVAYALTFVEDVQRDRRNDVKKAITSQQTLATFEALATAARKYTETQIALIGGDDEG